MSKKISQREARRLRARVTELEEEKRMAHERGECACGAWCKMWSGGEAMNNRFLLYHWSPASRRKSILKHGLVPGKAPVTNHGRASYVCFCRTPNMAWALSATQHGPGKWDLWMVWSHHVGGYATRRQNGPQLWKREYRVPRRIPKSRIWFVGTREFKSRRHE